MKILLEAPILTKSGYGEHARFVFRALQKITEKATNAQIHINPLSWGSTGWMSEVTEEKQKIDECIMHYAHHLNFCKEENKNPSWDVQIHVGIPNEFNKKAPYSICVTAGIETDRVDHSWLLKTHQGIQKIIVPSNHAKLGFTKTSYQISNSETGQDTLLECASKVEVVPYPAKIKKVKNLDFSLDTKFNFLSIAFLSPRKNIENMIKWFAEEFKDEPDVGLIVKTARSTGSIMDRKETAKILSKTLENHKDRKCKIYLLHGDLTEEEVHSLYTRDDIHAYVTSTHGEGFGLPIFEAAYSGMPIVATDWSAHLDFLSAPYKDGKSNKEKEKKLFAKVNYKISEIPQNVVWKDIIPAGSRWAFPDESSFKKQIRNMYKNHGMYKKWAKALKDNVHKTHEKDKILDQMVEAITSDFHPTIRKRLTGETSFEDVVVFE